MTAIFDRIRDLPPITERKGTWQGCIDEICENLNRNDNCHVHTVEETGDTLYTRKIGDGTHAGFSTYKFNDTTIDQVLDILYDANHRTEVFKKESCYLYGKTVLQESWDTNIDYFVLHQHLSVQNMTKVAVNGAVAQLTAKVVSDRELVSEAFWVQLEDDEGNATYTCVARGMDDESILAMPKDDMIPPSKFNGGVSVRGDCRWLFQHVRTSGDGAEVITGFNTDFNGKEGKLPTKVFETIYEFIYRKFPLEWGDHLREVIADAI